MKRLFRPLLLAFALLLPATPALAASTVFHFSFKGQGADAFFRSVDSSGCIETFVIVLAIDGKSKIDSQPPTSDGNGNIIIDVVDVCAGASLVSAFSFATFAPDAFVAQKADSATLDRSFEMFDFVSGTSFTVDVSLTWTGVGDPFRFKSRTQVRTPTFMLNHHGDGTNREATASGTVFDGTTNFTPDPSLTASLSTVKSGQVTIEKL